ncbi:MAG: tRNA uridine-5-carboxymethylaminomethyl(34) synthesis GTPase MnmE [Opitutaceae bacterium]
MSVIHAGTICAAATPAGESALAVVRISGSDTKRIATERAGSPPPPRRAVRRAYRTADSAELDDVVLTFFTGPRSYTGEDTQEISCHGNPFIVRRILEDLRRRGCRLAEPGEFTQRAFLCGRMGLTQAVAVMDVSRARGDRALAAAHEQLRGGLGRRLLEPTDGLLDALARIEAYIDFPDEDLPGEDRRLVADQIAYILLDINRLEATSRYGDILRDGIKTVILGATNTGKSSLLNRLVGQERALVSPEPGTTRDFIEEKVILGPHCLRLIDTAGFNRAPGLLEGMGIAKALERALTADLFLVVVDATDATPPPFPAELVARMNAKNTLLVINKVDLAPHPAIPRLLTEEASIEKVSALTGAGLEALVERITTLCDRMGYDPSDRVAINARHALSLQTAAEALKTAQAKLAASEAAELLASDLRAALDAIGEITGRIDNERMLDRLFATFCIGK